MKGRGERIDALLRDLYEVQVEASNRLGVRPLRVTDEPQDIEWDTRDPLDVAEQIPYLVRELLWLVDAAKRRR